MLSREELHTKLHERKEQQLKDLIEDRGTGSEFLARRAETWMRVWSNKFGPLSYDECIQLVAQNDPLIEDCGPFDPAYTFLVEQRNSMLKYAEALNDSESMGRHDHQLPVHALVSVDGVMVECNFWIPKLYYRENDRRRLIMSTLRSKLNTSSSWAGSIRLQSAVDFVEV